MVLARRIATVLVRITINEVTTVLIALAIVRQIQVKRDATSRRSGCFLQADAALRAAMESRVQSASQVKWERPKIKGLTVDPR